MRKVGVLLGFEVSFDSTGSGAVAGSASSAYPDWPTDVVWFVSSGVAWAGHS